MPIAFRQHLQTPAVERAQLETLGRIAAVPGRTDPEREPLGAEEVRFVGARDSFYLSSVGESGWPYVQHRGGPPGFLTVLDPHRLAYVELPGNRQLISTGNIMTNARVALILMDYPARERLKIIGVAQTFLPADREDLIARLRVPSGRNPVRVVVIEVVAFDWNCAQYITPRYTRAEVDELLSPLRRRVAELEARLI
ncbi:pyridoxamine 5'-phosphate oxidase family protein [Synoicihabitans lomoniglobus]|uniref:Pyridoxamine 5'-phosphate oxidase family protein n=1 Tax=Synoicihabitans lomoniglobus TaxID=2909285 RepID=A0AAE9ZVQ2_9BACT|nr:pyridoxamine 5'-phosphate oxidase family protein [Opitutaceae bacterium LMO-M01]WED64977.1 pyridoxamine 5'-phosphate oxidase family protein [Opitutaceae bacterium LMO-M01]